MDDDEKDADYNIGDEVDDSEEDPHLSSKTKKKIIEWERPNTIAMPKFQWQDVDYGNANVLSPLEYFHRYVPVEEFEKMANFTNIYALQSRKTFRLLIPKYHYVKFQ